jgi:hypothetical protein
MVHPAFGKTKEITPPAPDVELKPLSFPSSDLMETEKLVTDAGGLVRLTDTVEPAGIVFDPPDVTATVAVD